MLQQKVEEDYVSLILSQEESANEAAEGGEPRAEQAPRRAMEIPGAVRVLPPMPGGTPSGSGATLATRGSSSGWLMTHGSSFRIARHSSS